MPNFTPLLTYNNVHIHTYNYSPKSAWLHGLHFWLSRLLMLWTLETVAPYGATMYLSYFWWRIFIFMHQYFHAIFHEKFIPQYVCPCDVDLGILGFRKETSLCPKNSWGQFVFIIWRRFWETRGHWNLPRIHWQNSDQRSYQIKKKVKLRPHFILLHFTFWTFLV